MTMATALQECAGCGAQVDLLVHDEIECQQQHETHHQHEERMRLLAEDQAFDAFRERDL